MAALVKSIILVSEMLAVFDCCSYTVSVDGRDLADISSSSSGNRISFSWINPNNYRSKARFEIGCKTRDGVKCPGPIYVIYGDFKKCQGRKEL